MQAAGPLLAAALAASLAAVPACAGRCRQRLPAAPRRPAPPLPRPRRESPQVALGRDLAIAGRLRWPATTARAARPSPAACRWRRRSARSSPRTSRPTATPASEPGPPSSSGTPCTTACGRDGAKPLSGLPLPLFHPRHPAPTVRRALRLFTHRAGGQLPAAGQQAAVPAEHPAAGRLLERALLQAGRLTPGPPGRRLEPRLAHRQGPGPLRRLPYAQDPARAATRTAMRWRAACSTTGCAGDSPPTRAAAWAPGPRRDRGISEDRPQRARQRLRRRWPTWCLFHLADDRRRPRRHRRLSEGPAGPRRPSPACTRRTRKRDGRGPGDLRRRLRRLPRRRRQGRAQLLPAAAGRGGRPVDRPDQRDPLHPAGTQHRAHATPGRRRSPCRASAGS